MDCTRNKLKNVISYIENLGIKVNLKTKARGHQGFFLNNRIDISKNIPKDKIMQILLHEFAHFVFLKRCSNIEHNKNTLSIIFDTNDDIFNELTLVTNFVDTNSKLDLLKTHKKIIKEKIQEQENIIKTSYPKFKRSKKFREFDRFIRFSKAKYLLKYDRIKYITPFLRRVEYYSISNIEKDFDMPKAFYAYIKLKSYQRKQNRISLKINRLKKYYFSPSELFARFIEGYYLDKIYINKIAPKSYEAFNNAILNGYYPELKKVLSMVLE